MMKSVGFSKRQKMIAATSSPGLKTIVSDSPVRMHLTGAGVDVDDDKNVAYLLLDDVVYSSTSQTAVDVANALIDLNEGFEPGDDEYETFDLELCLANSSKGRQYISISLF